MTTRGRRIGRRGRARSGPELGRIATLVSSLVTSSDDELELFRTRMLGAAPLDEAQLSHVRDLLDTIGEALLAAADRRTDTASHELWLRLDLGWHALFGGGWVAGPALVSDAPAARATPARDTLPPHARAALEALEQREASHGSGSPVATVPLGPSGTIDAGPAGLAARTSSPPPARASAPPPERISAPPPMTPAPSALAGAAPPAMGPPAAPPAPYPPLVPAPSGSTQARVSPSEVGRLMGATTQVDYTKKVDPAELPFVQAVRLAGALAHGPTPSTPPPAAATPSAPPAAVPDLPPHLARMSVEQFATYCAQCAETPERVAAIDERYGIDGPSARAALEQHWRARLAADPALLAAWREHLQRAQRFVKRKR